SSRPPYYEKAMMMRSIENTIYFASVNYALRFKESATSLIGPDGRCQAHLPYGQEGVLVESIHVDEATGLLATRFAPDRYREDRGRARPRCASHFPRHGTPGIVAHVDRVARHRARRGRARESRVPHPLGRPP